MFKALHLICCFSHLTAPITWEKGKYGMIRPQDLEHHIHFAGEYKAPKQMKALVHSASLISGGLKAKQKFSPNIF